MTWQKEIVKCWSTWECQQWTQDYNLVETKPIRNKTDSFKTKIITGKVIWNALISSKFFWCLLSFHDFHWCLSGRSKWRVFHPRWSASSLWNGPHRQAAYLGDNVREPSAKPIFFKPGCFRLLLFQSQSKVSKLSWSLWSLWVYRAKS